MGSPNLYSFGDPGSQKLWVPVFTRHQYWLRRILRSGWLCLTSRPIFKGCMIWFFDCFCTWDINFQILNLTLFLKYLTSLNLTSQNLTSPNFYIQAFILRVWSTSREKRTSKRIGVHSSRRLGGVGEKHAQNLWLNRWTPGLLLLWLNQWTSLYLELQRMSLYPSSISWSTYGILPSYLVSEQLIVNMAHCHWLCVDLREHSIVSCSDYLWKMRSGNETKHSMVPSGAHLQARPETPPRRFGGAYAPFRPPSL